jgi:hypothetical protein
MEEMICKDAKKFQHAISNSIELKEVSIVTFWFLNIFNSKLKYHKEVKDNIDKNIYFIHEIMENI